MEYPGSRVMRVEHSSAEASTRRECHNWSGRVRPPQDNRLVRVQIINARALFSPPVLSYRPSPSRSRHLRERVAPPSPLVHPAFSPLFSPRNDNFWNVASRRRWERRIRRRSGYRNNSTSHATCRIKCPRLSRRGLIMPPRSLGGRSAPRDVAPHSE